MSSLLQPARSDEQLTGAIATGDRDAFEELYRRYAGPLAAYGARVLHDRSRREDVAQTALARAYEALQKGTEPLRVRPWLYKIALNTALEQRAKNGEVLDGESDEHEDVVQETSAQRADILAAVQVLPERQRMVFFLREVQGLSVGEVAERVGLDNQQVEQALFSARNRLAEELVFGRRVDCNLVRSLDAKSLTRFERRALKGHLRGCPSCRHNAGFGFTSVALWARDAWQWVIGGGGAGTAASAAKVGALAVTAAAIGTAPVTVPVIAHKLSHHARAPIAAATDPLPPGEPSTELRQLDQLKALFVPSFARKLAPPFEAPQPQPPVPADPMAALPITDPSLVEPPADQSSNPGPYTAADPQPGDQTVADQSPSDTTPTGSDSTSTDGTTDSTVDSNATDTTATDGGTASSTDPSATDTTATDTTATDTTATDTTATDTTATDTTATVTTTTP